MKRCSPNSFRHILAVLIFSAGCGSGVNVPTTQSGLEQLVKDKLVEAGRDITDNYTGQINQICSNAGYDPGNAESLTQCMEAIANGEVNLSLGL